MSEEIDILNKKIGQEYVTIDGHKIFRLVWSEDIFENRHGTFREFTSGGLFIREVTETKRVRKYNYIHNRWIFEMWAPGNLVANPETPDAANGDYVPVYVFEDRGGHYLPPNEKVVRFLISALHGKVKKDEIPSREYLEERQLQRDIDSMDDHPAWFQTRPGAARNAIWYPGGVPQWHHRRAAIGPGDFIDVESFRRVEEHARQLARERRESKDAEIRQQEVAIQEVVRQENERKQRELEERRNLTIAQQEREKQEAEAEKAREYRAQETVVHQQQISDERANVETRSPMHRGRQ